jgi:hypothetical protein
MTNPSEPITSQSVVPIDIQLVDRQVRKFNQATFGCHTRVVGMDISYVDYVGGKPLK